MDDGATVECCNCEAQQDDGCFPATSILNLANGKSVKMSELQIGDFVQTGTGIITFILKIVQRTKMTNTSNMK